MKKKATPKKMTIDNLAVLIGSKFKEQQAVSDSQFREQGAKFDVFEERHNALIEYLDKRFGKLETDMSEIKVEIKGLQSDVDILKNKIGSLEDALGAQSVTSLKSEIATCNTKINQLTVHNINLRSGYDTEITQLKNDIILLQTKVGQLTT